MFFLRAVFSNFFGYDLLIIALGIFNIAYVFPTLKKRVDDLEVQLKPIRYKSIDMLEEYFHLSEEKQLIRLDSLEKRKEQQSFLFHLMNTLGSIFPLMGILGTILALVSLREFTSDLVVSRFSMALTSTFWGLLFAIVTRVFEGFITPRIENNERQIDILFKLESYKSERNNEKK